MAEEPRPALESPLMEAVEYVAPAVPVPAARLITTLPSGLKVKERIPRMRACDEKNDKGKFCHGHLKRWYTLTGEAREALGNPSEVYRCERCHTVFMPNPDERPRTATLAW